MKIVEWNICPKCKKREREVTFDGYMEFYCDVCNDKLAEHYRERKEWDQFHDR